MKTMIFAHFYTREEVHRVADFVPVSPSPCKVALRSKAEVIFLASIYLMADSISIIFLVKVVLLPVLDEICQWQNNNLKSIKK